MTQMHFADLHLHSRFSRATSADMDLHHLAASAKVKGLTILGTGDFTHPRWLAELKAALKEAGGIYEFGGVKWLLQTELSLIYSKGKKTRRVHHLLFAPDFDTVEQINSWLGSKGRLDYDGRPIFGITSEELVENMMEISRDIMVVPAHAWTPWFSIFGSRSGFDSVEECFGDQAKHIFALESGLSSDPAMNWRLSKLDKYMIVSFSDAHSSWRLGRECCLFDLKKPDYNELVSAIKERDTRRFLMTVEFHPEEGKYHWDGHRNCGVVQSPKETAKKGDKCRVCGKQLTIGVAYRVEQLADRKEGFVPKNAIPFKSLVPLAELISAAIGSGVASNKVTEIYNQLIARFGNEFAVLLDAPEGELAKTVPEKLAKLIIKSREGKLRIEPGYDGVYGKLHLDGKEPTLGEFVR